MYVIFKSSAQSLTQNEPGFIYLNTTVAQT